MTAAPCNLPRQRVATPVDLLQVSVAEPRDGTVVVAPVGEIDVSTAPVLRRTVLEVLETRPRRVVIDLSGLTFCGSTGLVALMDAKERATGCGVGFGTAGGRAIMLRVLEITGFGPALGHQRTLECALRDGYPAAT